MQQKATRLINNKNKNIWNYKFFIPKESSKYLIQYQLNLIDILLINKLYY